MLLLLDTSTGLCSGEIVHNAERHAFEWQADRSLADGLLSYLEKVIKDAGFSWTDITGIGVYRGPGSFTGLRIGITVMNAFASTLSIPIVGESGEHWKDAAITRLDSGGDDKIVLPEYGREANITKPRK